MRKRRRREVQPRGGTTKAACLRNGDECRQFSEIARSHD
jgi:hypothetical protein